MITSEWGTPEHGEGRRESRAAAGRQVRAEAARVGPAQADPPPGARPRRRAADGARAPAGAQSDPRLRLRRRRRLAGGSVELDLPLVSRRQRTGTGKGEWKARKVITIPAMPADEADLPPLLKGFKAVPPLVTDINLSVDDRFLYVSCWGTGELRQYDVSDPFNPVFTGSVKLGGIVARTAHASDAGTSRSTAVRRWSRSAATGGGSTSPTRSTRPGTRSSTRTASAAGWRRSMPRPSGGLVADPAVPRRARGRSASAPGAAAGR